MSTGIDYWAPQTSGTYTTGGYTSANWNTSIGSGDTSSSNTIGTSLGGNYYYYYGGGIVGGTLQGQSIYNVPVTLDEMKSKPKFDEGPHDHVIECRFRIEPTKVIAEYFCGHCQDVLHSKVISKLPKKLLKSQCLPRLLKGV